MHGRSKISGMLPKSFNAGKCKTALKLAASRIKLLKNRREAAVKQLRRDLAQLLEAGQEQTARIRVEHVIREENTMSAYDLIEVYCEMIVVRLPMIESQKICPTDMKEAITSVVFAAPRCADIPELMDVHKHFTAKYGKEFITAATEVRQDCGVGRMMIEKLSTKPPDIEVKIKVLKAVAKEHNVTWEPNPFGESIQMPKEDLLNGPTSFISGSMLMKSSPTHSWSNVPTKRMSQNDFETAQSVISDTIPVNARGPSILVSSGISERKSNGEEVNHMYSKDESASNSNWNVEFKDATTAAEAAAESAEMASLAARAAAELAIRGSFTRHPSADHESLIHADENGISGSLRISKLQNQLIAKESMDGEGNKRRGPDDIKMDVQYQYKGSMTQDRRSAEAKSLNYRQPNTARVIQGRPHSSGMSQEPGRKQYDYSQTSLSDISAASRNSNNGTSDNPVKVLNEKHINSAPSPGSTSSGDDKSWPDRESITVDFSEVASADCDSDVDAHSVTGEEEDLLDFLRHGKRRSSKAKSLSTNSSLQMHSIAGHCHCSSSERVVITGPSSLNSSDNYVSEADIEATKRSSLQTQGNYRKEPSANGKRVTKEDIPSSRSALSSDARDGLSPRTIQRTSRNISSLSSGGLSEEEEEEEEEKEAASESPISDESSVSGGLNFGRLTGGLRNRSYHLPPHVRKPSTDGSPVSRINSADMTSSEARIEQKATQESLAKIHAPKLVAYEEQSHDKKGEEIRSTLKSEVSNQVLHDQKPRAEVNNVRGSRMLNRYPNFDSDKSEEQEPRRITTAPRNSDVKPHTRRTVGVPPDAKGDASFIAGGSSESKSSLRSETDTFSMKTRVTQVEADHKVSGGESEYRRLSGPVKNLCSASWASSSQEEQARNSDTNKNDESSKASGSSSTATSRENSLKKCSHTHPKLPDYETLAQHFLSLRSNVRPK